MKLNSVIFSITILLIAVICIFSLRDNLKIINCEATIVIIDNKNTANIDGIFNINGKTGMLYYNVQLSKLGQSTETITNEINFDIIINGQQHLFLNTNMKITKGDSSTIRKIKRYLPDFFWSEGKAIVMEIYPYKKSGYVFTYNNTPIFYCTNVSPES